MRRTTRNNDTSGSPRATGPAQADTQHNGREIQQGADDELLRDALGDQKRFTRLMEYRDAQCEQEAAAYERRKQADAEATKAVEASRAKELRCTITVIGVFVSVIVIAVAIVAAPALEVRVMGPHHALLRLIPHAGLIGYASVLALIGGLYRTLKSARARADSVLDWLRRLSGQKPDRPQEVGANAVSGPVTGGGSASLADRAETDCACSPRTGARTEQVNRDCPTHHELMTGRGTEEPDAS